MLETVAVLSDVHGVLPVLEAVLAEPDVRSADLVVVTGDHALGPQPRAVLDRLTAEGTRLTLVQGNADRELVALRRGRDVPSADDITLWAADELRSEQVDLLDSLPHPWVEEIEGFGPTLFCHGTPRQDDEVVLVDSSMAKWAAAFEGLDDRFRTVVCGHTHMPFVRLVDRRVVVNPGSVGMPYGLAGGSWALLSRGRVSLHRTAIDVDTVIEDVVAGSTFPGRRDWAETYIGARYSDADALAAFGARPRSG